MNAEQKLKKIVGSKLSQAGFNPSHATDEILKLFRSYINASDENKATVYTEGEERIKYLLAVTETESAPPKKVLHFKAPVK